MKTILILLMVSLFSCSHRYKLKDERTFFFEDPYFSNATNYTDSKIEIPLKKSKEGKYFFRLGAQKLYVKSEALAPATSSKPRPWILRAISRTPGKVRFFIHPNKDEKDQPDQEPFVLTRGLADGIHLSLWPLRPMVDFSTSEGVSGKRPVRWTSKGHQMMEISIPLKKIHGFSWQWENKTTLNLSYKETLGTPTTLVIDPGHGEGEGACVEGICEEAIIQKFIGYFEQSLKKNPVPGLKIHYTRKPSDPRIELRERVKFAESLKADIFISLHVDSWVQGTEGLRAWLPVPKKQSCYYKSEFSLPLAQEICPNGLVTQRNLHVLHSWNFPSVLLELGNLQKPDERRDLADDQWLKDAADKLVKRLGDYIRSNR